MRTSWVHLMHVGPDLPHSAVLPLSADRSLQDAMSVKPIDVSRSRERNGRNRDARAAFLSGANSLLTQTMKLIGAGLDEDETLASVARLALPRPGAWSMVDVRFGSARRILVSDQFAHHRTATEALSNGWPAIRPGADATAPVIRSSRSELVPLVNDAMLLQVADSPRQMLLLRELAIGSALTVWLRTTGDETFGALTFFAPSSGPAFDESDRLLAEDVAAGAALAIVHARLGAAGSSERRAERDEAAERFAFLSSFSHGLRTPLHAIQGYAQLLAEGVHGPLRDPQHHYLERIQANERHVLQLVSSAVSYALWDTERMILEDILVRTAVRQASAAVARAARTKGVAFSPQRDDSADELVVRAEPRRLREILLQLLLNGVKYSKPDGALTIDAHAVGERVLIRVTDTGIGIAPRDLDSIFLPFRPSNANLQDGAGLGLAITRKLARAIGGELSVTSQPGVGSTFTLALPRGRTSASVQA